MKKYSIIIIISILVLTFTFTNITNVNAIVTNKTTTTKVVQPRAVGDTIALTFPDVNLANAIATELAKTYPGTDINTVLTLPMAQSIKVLSLGNKDIADITGIDVFTNLESLYLSTNNLTSVPDSIGTLTKLKVLNLYNNKLSAVPASITNLINLTDLNIERNSITSIPVDIGNLTKLIKFNASRNKITVIPSSLTNLTNLTELILYQNNITVIPDSIGNLTKLIKFSINTNKINSIPNSFGNLINLTDIDFSYNEMTEIPDFIFNLTKLKGLDFSVNRLTSVPDRIGELVNLTTLELQYNKISTIPDSVGNLTKLQYVFLSENQLSNLPTTISSWTKVKYLEVGDNMLPDNYVTIINGLGWENDIYGISQRKIVVKDGITPYDITDLTQIDDIDLHSLVEMNSYYLVSDVSVSPSLNLSLEKYTDDTGAEVDLSTYIVNGIVQKNGPVYGQIRAESTGLFENNSNNSLTENKLQFNFRRIEFDLSFDLNGVDATAIPVQKLIENEVSKVVVDPAAIGYTFKGWNTKADGTGVTWTLGTNTMSNTAVTLYAQWDANQYTITYDLDGGSITTTNPATYTFGVGIQQFNIPTKAGYTFAGWMNTTTGDQNITSISTTQTGNLTLKATWTDSNLIIEPGTKLPGNENKLPSTGSDINMLGIITLLLISSTCVYCRFKYIK